MPEKVSNNQRIAKNTVLLYIRTFLVMLISLYTSRVVLQALGVEDYGVYQVVGGVVGMFSVISAALTTSISRYITYEIGSGNEERLRKVFSTSMAVQLVIAAIVIILVEVVGVWFLKTQMQIPEGRMTAAFWVMQCSLLTFCIDLISLPYNACIVAHEHMKAFAYISVLQAVLKLGICYLIMISPIDRLIAYAILMVLVSALIRLIYTIYCHKHFDECLTPIRLNKEMFKEMFGFAGWSFLTNTTFILNTQGVNMLINVFFGVVYNAARGVANQIESAVMQFVNSFTVAINPQITKSYASGEKDEMFTLVCRGARFSYYLMFIMALPIICEAETILNIWLVNVPDKTALFVQLTLINGMLDCIGNSSYTAIISTGKIKRYTIVISIITLLVFPFSWLFYYMGAPVEFSYFIYIVIRLIVLIVRMILLQQMLGFNAITFIKEVYLPVIYTTVFAIIPSIIILKILPATYFRLMLSIVTSILMVGSMSLLVGMSQNERVTIVNKARNFINK